VLECSLVGEDYSSGESVIIFLTVTYFLNGVCYYLVVFAGIIFWYYLATIASGKNFLAGLF